MDKSAADSVKCEPGASKDDRTAAAALKPALEDSQSLWQLVLLTRMWQLVQLRRQRHIDQSDVRALPKGCDSQQVALALDRSFQQYRGRWSLVRSLLAFASRRLLPFVLSNLLLTTPFMFTPLLTKVIINHIRDRQAGENASLAPALVVSILLPIIFCAAAVSGQNEFAASNKYGSAIRGGLVYQVVARTSQITDGARLAWTDGRVLSLISGDGARVIEAVVWLGLGIESVVNMTVVSVLILITLGAPALAGIAIVVAGVLGQVGIARFVQAARARATAFADRRMILTHEFLTGLTATKLQGWEQAAARRIQAIRRQEISALRTRKILNAFDSILSRAVPVLALTVAFAAAEKIKANPDGATLFSSFRA